MVVHFKNQHFDKLRKTHQQNGTLFTDVEFPADDSSLYLPGQRRGGAVVEWKRPKVGNTSVRASVAESERRGVFLVLSAYSMDEVGDREAQYRAGQRHVMYIVSGKELR